MRLLSTTDLLFKEFYDSQIPRYAILSHRWIGEEVTFEEFYQVKAQDSSGERFAKIKKCCAQARTDGWYWVWIDTCCIDKKSSAELTEAINSMFNWYRRAAVCYVYLADVVWNPGNLEDLENSRRIFRNSEWFRRGWTLQELLAPYRLCFFDYAWISIGAAHKSPKPLEAVSPLIIDICAASGISEDDFFDFPIRNFYVTPVSVARKMSWLSHRETSRVEDIAYCAMGLFDVNMPLIYGEGKKAFERLQLEIIKISDDESIFAWFSDRGLLSNLVSGVLAKSPKDFARSGQVVRRDLRGKLPFAITNKGLHYRIPHPRGRFPWKKDGTTYTYMLLLNCGLENPSLNDSRVIALEFRQTQQFAGTIVRKKGIDDVIMLDSAIWNNATNKKPEYEDVYLMTNNLSHALVEHSFGLTTEINRTQ